MRIPRSVLDGIAEHARESLPAECCGILLGAPDGAPTVSRALRAKNAERETPDRKYVLGEEAHLRAVEMEAAGVACIVGYYHSHTDGSTSPSPRDLALAVEGTVYLIAGIGHGPARHAAWRLEGNEFLAEPLEEVNEQHNE